MINSVRVISTSKRQDFSPRDDEPMLLKGWAQNWPAYSKWILEYFSEKFGEQNVAISNYVEDQYRPTKNKPRARIRDYIRTIRGELLETKNLNRNSYIAGWHFRTHAPQLFSDIDVPECFRDNLIERVRNEVISFYETSLFI